MNAILAFFLSSKHTSTECDSDDDEQAGERASEDFTNSDYVMIFTPKTQLRKQMNGVIEQYGLYVTEEEITTVLEQAIVTFNRLSTDNDNTTEAFTQVQQNCVDNLTCYHRIRESAENYARTDPDGTIYNWMKLDWVSDYNTLENTTRKYFKYNEVFQAAKKNTADLVSVRKQLFEFKFNVSGLFANVKKCLSDPNKQFIRDAARVSLYVNGELHTFSDAICFKRFLAIKMQMYNTQGNHEQQADIILHLCTQGTCCDMWKTLPEPFFLSSYSSASPCDYSISITIEDGILQVCHMKPFSIVNTTKRWVISHHLCVMELNILNNCGLIQWKDI